MRRHALPLACFAGVLLYVALLAHFTPAWRHGSIVFPGWILGGLAWCGVIVLARAGRISLRAVIGGALVLRAVALTGWPDLSDDIFRYVWEGELITRGISPFAYGPDHPALLSLADQMPGIHSQINHPDVSAAYPPVMQAACALVMGLEHQVQVGGVFLMRLFFTLCDLLVILPLVHLLKHLGKPVGLAAVWAWSPLVVTEFAGSGHFDSLGILALLGSLALFAGLQGARLQGARSVLAHGLLAGAILVKYIPLLALPFVVRGRRPWLRSLAVGVVVVAAFLPVLALDGGATGLFAGLGNYSLNWQSSGIVHPHLARLFDAVFAQDGGFFDARRMVRLALAGLWFSIALLAWRRRMDVVGASGLLLGVFWVLSPTLHPWYVTWVVPFIAFWPGHPWRCPWTWLALTVPLTYGTLERWKLEGVWEQSGWIQSVIAVPLLLLLFFAARQAFAPSKSVESV